jgi:CDP-diacylglycerol--serine O-phosphatidyltransferase
MIDNNPRKNYRKRRPRIDTLKRGVYILPNFLTSMGLFCGFFSIISIMQGDYLRAAWAIVIAGVFDGLDGRIARMTNTTSKFGLEYDSLADLVAFGVAPALLSYAWVLDQYGRLGWLAAFLYVACGAVRLARFNVMTDIVKSSHFLGLPIPGAAGMVSTTVIFCFHFNFVDKVPLSIIFVLLIFFLAFLMVSSIKFSSFKGLDLKTKKPISSVVLVIMLIVIIAAEPQIVLFCIGIMYLVSGLMFHARDKLKRRKIEDCNIRTLEGKDGGNCEK